MLNSELEKILKDIYEKFLNDSSSINVSFKDYDKTEIDHLIELSLIKKNCDASTLEG